MQKERRKPVVLKANNLVEKRNLLNEMKTNHMTLQEVRFFTIYLSKINARDINSRYVRFPLDEFQSIMELGRLTIPSLQGATDRLLSKIVNIKTERGGYVGFQLFSKCRVDKDENEDWFIEINAHDDALPLMFDFKKEYFTYELWNALKLNSLNQIRMYELLKQYEKYGERIITLKDLRDFIGIKENQYPRFGDFNTSVLKKSQKSLKENTDIHFKYELIKKGVRVVAIKFSIATNKDYSDQICFEEFTEIQKKENEIKLNLEAVDESKQSEIISAYREMLSLSKNNLSDDEILCVNQMAFEYLLATQKIGESPLLEQIEYVKKQMLYVNTKKNIKSYYTYLLSAIEKNYAMD